MNNTKLFRTGDIILLAGLLMVGLEIYSCGGHKQTARKDFFEGVTEIDQGEPSGLPVTRSYGLQFFKSYRQKGGPHLVVDSLNVAIPLTEAELWQMLNFAKEALHINEARKVPGVLSDAPQIVKYYSASQTPSQFLGKESSYNAVKNGAYFKAVYAADGQLLSLEYFSQQNSKNPVSAPLVHLTSSKATVWDLVFNRPLYYVDADGQRFPSRAVILRDSTRLIRFVDYLNENGGKVARSTFYYGTGDKVIEQRIEFEGEGNLTDLNSFLFDKQFNIVKRGWLVKGFYNEQRYLKKLVVMDDLGNRYYDYRFGYKKTEEGVTVTNQVFDQAGQPGSFCELFYNEHGRLVKRVSYGRDRAVCDYQIFTIDYEKMKQVVEFYRPDGTLVDRLYKSL